MADLLRTRCTAGWLVITEGAVRIERKGLLGAGGRSEVLPRQSLTGATLQNRMGSVMGHGGGSKLIFTGMGGMVIKADFVNPADAERAMSILGFA
ncbi:MAG: hypothetical protein ACLQUY_15040 [Ktedonobacterales bacterium]